jgi:predicted anti-sigma-YlaC factor YlaD
MTNELSRQANLSCEEVAPLLEKRIVDETLTPGETHILNHHLQNCNDCVDFISWSKGLSVFAPDISKETALHTSDNTTAHSFTDQRRKHRQILAAVTGIAAAAILGFLILFNS